MADVDRGSKDEKEDKFLEKKTQVEWELAEPLRAVDSPLRINLYGKSRVTTKPVITPIIQVQPWGLGSNQVWGI